MKYQTHEHDEGAFLRGVVITRSKASRITVAAKSRFAHEAKLSEISEAVSEIKEQLNVMRLVLSAPSNEKHPADWLGSSDAAKYLRMSKTTFEKHLYCGPIKINSYLVGGKRLFKRADLDRWVITHNDKLRGYA
jgi:excisionase family DNA binding protein